VPEVIPLLALAVRGWFIPSEILLAGVHYVEVPSLDETYHRNGRIYVPSTVFCGGGPVLGAIVQFC
jgi:hypothetical protein